MPRVSLQQQFEEGLGVVGPNASLCVGLSGGLDSVVLLHLCRQIREASGGKLKALHVHHGLSPNADAWATFCARLCAELKVQFQVVRVRVDRDAGIGLEAAAREARHAVFREVDADWIALAHHADDAAETILLRLLRGTGIKGLAGMAVTRRIDGRRQIVRPLLGARRAELEAYARQANLRWIEDESNRDVGLDRNFLRHEVLARLDGRFPGYPDTWLRAAQHAADAQRLLDELAAQDVGDTENGLSLTAMRRLTEHRARNALRWFLDSQGLRQPDGTTLEEMARQIQACGPEAHLGFDVEGRQLKRHQDRVVVVEEDGGVSAFLYRWNGEPSLAVPELGGRIEFVATVGSGIAATKTREAAWVVKSRAGGEVMRRRADGPSRSLKNLFQESGVPQWERNRQPLLMQGEKLVWVPALGIAAEYRAKPGEPGIDPRWLPARGTA